MNFKSDNTAPLNQEIVSSLESVNQDFQDAYGNDDSSLKLKTLLSDFFEKEVSVFLTSTGTAANGIALSTLVKPYEAIFCSEAAHIYTDECGAVELFTDGAKLLPISGQDGKINPEVLEMHIQTLQGMRPHTQKPGCVSLTQATEWGTVYNLKDIESIVKVAQKYELPVHMDGARFSNALVRLGVKPCEMTWKQGIDILSFGATKNGALCAEAIVVFNPTYAQDLDYRHKRAGQLMSKGRFFASQFLGYLENDLWKKNAIHANEMAQKLSELFEKKQIFPLYSVESNEIFVHLSPQWAQYLQEQGVGFYSWGHEQDCFYRFVTSWYTSQKDLDSFEEILNRFF